VEHVEVATRNSQQDGGVTSIEASRRHGPFDPRRQKRRFRAASSRPVPGLEDELGWDAFSSRYFSGRGRHDLEAISAYDATSRTR
jgi:hypothetical protein